VLLRYVAYLPGVEQPVPLKVVAKSEETDAALLECEPGRCAGPPLALSPRLPRPGEEIIVLGYPTGISALVARADPALAPLLDRAGGFWEVARRLSSKRQIAPLATRGIVGQVTDGVIVYDAETTSGASGSPVLDLEGHVVALNTAVLGDFHGANMGIPAAHLRALLEEAGRRDRDGFHDAGRSGSAASPPRGLSLSR
jgi:S1-C subfamily serine protease